LAEGTAFGRMRLQIQQCLDFVGCHYHGCYQPRPGRIEL
jgi:hypothetical protein